MPFTHASTFLTPGSSSVDRCISTILTIYFLDINLFIHLTFQSFFLSFFFYDHRDNFNFFPPPESAVLREIGQELFLLP